MCFFQGKITCGGYSGHKTGQFFFQLLQNRNISTRFKLKKMEKVHQLNTCKVCNNISYNIERGIVCSVTNDIAAFDKKCSNYSKSIEILTMDSIKDYRKDKMKNLMIAFLKKHIVPAFAILLLIAIGYSMILWPDLFETTVARKADGGANQFVNIIWSVPAGIILLFTGIYFLVIYVKRRKSYLL